MERERQREEEGIGLKLFVVVCGMEYFGLSPHFTLSFLPQVTGQGEFEGLLDRQSRTARSRTSSEQ